MAVERSHSSLFQLRETTKKRENVAFLDFIIMTNVTSVVSFYSAKPKELQSQPRAWNSHITRSRITVQRLEVKRSNNSGEEEKG